MQSRRQAGRKGRQNDDSRDDQTGLLSVRSAFVLFTSLFVAGGVAALLYVSHRLVALAMLGSLGAFAAAVKLLDAIIDRRP